MTASTKSTETPARRFIIREFGVVTGYGGFTTILQYQYKENDGSLLAVSANLQLAVYIGGVVSCFQRITPKFTYPSPGVSIRLAHVKDVWHAVFQ